jgi:hypothetical protein
VFAANAVIDDPGDFSAFVWDPHVAEVIDETGGHCVVTKNCLFYSHSVHRSARPRWRGHPG